MPSKRNLSTVNDEIAIVKNKIRQSENRVNELAAKNREQNYKARTRRLIQRGAILESFIDGAVTLTNEQIQAILSAAVSKSVVRDMTAAFFKESEAAATEETP